MKNWDYSNLSKEAKEHGGPKSYINLLEDNARGEGRTEGGIVGSIVGSLVTLVIGTAGILIHNHFKKRKQAKQLAPVVRQELLGNAKKYGELADIENSENEM